MLKQFICGAILSEPHTDEICVHMRTYIHTCMFVSNSIIHSSCK